ncbi:MAG: hypothetical protein KKF52_05465 [Nanoarchaeota archaeon]|nr:hypothetical protein [Nanoarchaeota archaeon]MBU4352602.1 hypothetical protein [Nanoarchaeota archaeon]MCG2720101.1 hypothetical protein [Nanoarchaeota archaeon]
MILKDIEEDKVIQRFEEIFENKNEKLRDTILLDNNMKNLHSLFTDRGRKSIKLADFLYRLSFMEHFEKEFLDVMKQIKIKYFFNLDEVFYDWVTEIAYYGMYDLATSAIAKEGFKCTTHYTTRLTLEYLYCIKGKDREKLFKIYDRILLKRQLIQDLKNAQDKREIARYKAPDLISQKDAEEILEDAKEFEKEILPLIVTPSC